MARAAAVSLHFPSRASRHRSVLLNGATGPDPDLELVEGECVTLLADQVGSIEVFRMRDVPVAYCQGCFDCWVKHPGVCRTDDAGREITRAWARADLVVLLTPITFGGYSSELKKGLDRSIGLVSPFVTHRGGGFRHRPRYARYPSLLGVGVLPEARAEEERIFHELVRRNAGHLFVPAYQSLVLYRTQGAARMRAALNAAVGHLVFAA